MSHKLVFTDDITGKTLTWVPRTEEEAMDVAYHLMALKIWPTYSQVVVLDTDTDAA